MLHLIIRGSATQLKIKVKTACRYKDEVGSSNSLAFIMLVCQLESRRGSGWWWEWGWEPNDDDSTQVASLMSQRTMRKIKVTQKSRNSHLRTSMRRKGSLGRLRETRPISPKPNVFPPLAYSHMWRDWLYSLVFPRHFHPRPICTPVLFFTL